MENDLDDNDDLPCDGSVDVYVPSVEIYADDTPQEAADVLIGAFGAEWCAELWRVLAGTV